MIIFSDYFFMKDLIKNNSNFQDSFWDNNRIYGYTPSENELEDALEGEYKNILECFPNIEIEVFNNTDKLKDYLKYLYKDTREDFIMVVEENKTFFIFYNVFHDEEREEILYKGVSINVLDYLPDYFDSYIDYFEEHN